MLTKARTAVTNIPFRAGTTIARLFRSGSPAAIRWLVVSVIIFAFEGEFALRFVAHVRNKVLETFKPSFANNYSASSIVFVGFIFLVVASVAHMLPSSIFRSDLAVACMSMLMVQSVFMRCKHISLPASAALFVPSSQFYRPCSSFLAAIAKAHPLSLESADRSQPMELLVAKV
jgi:hypothetical protein